MRDEEIARLRIALRSPSDAEFNHFICSLLDDGQQRALLVLEAGLAISEMQRNCDDLLQRMHSAATVGGRQLEETLGNSATHNRLSLLACRLNCERRLLGLVYGRQSMIQGKLPLPSDHSLSEAQHANESSAADCSEEKENVGEEKLKGKESAEEEITTPHVYLPSSSLEDLHAKNDVEGKHQEGNEEESEAAGLGGAQKHVEEALESLSDAGNQSQDMEAVDNSSREVENSNPLIANRNPEIWNTNQLDDNPMPVTSVEVIERKEDISRPPVYSPPPIVSPSPLPHVSHSPPPVSSSLSPIISPSLPPQVSPSLPPQVSPSLPPQVSPSLPPQVSPSLPPQVSTSLPPQVSPSLPPQVSPSLHPQVSPSLSHQVSTSLPPQVSPSLLPQVSTSLPPQVSPSLSPQVSPSLSPQVSPSIPPQVSPSLPPQVSPSLHPQVSPSLSHQVSTSLPPQVSPSLLPQVSTSLPPQVSLSLSPQVSPSLSPQVSPSIPPQVSPSLPPQVSPSLPPQVSLSLSPQVSPSSPNNVSPSSPNNVSPSSPNNVLPSSPNNVSPSSPNNVSPSSPNNVLPSSPNNVSPSSPNNVSPSSPLRVSPSPLRFKLEMEPVVTQEIVFAHEPHERKKERERQLGSATNFIEPIEKVAGDKDTEMIREKSEESLWHAEGGKKKKNNLDDDRSNHQEDSARLHQNMNEETDDEKCMEEGAEASSNHVDAAGRGDAENDEGREREEQGSEWVDEANTDEDLTEIAVPDSLIDGVEVDEEKAGMRCRPLRGTVSEENISRIPTATATSPALSSSPRVRSFYSQDELLSSPASPAAKLGFERQTSDSVIDEVSSHDVYCTHDRETDLKRLDEWWEARKRGHSRHSPAHEASRHRSDKITDTDDIGDHRARPSVTAGGTQTESQPIPFISIKEEENDTEMATEEDTNAQEGTKAAEEEEGHKENDNEYDEVPFEKAEEADQAGTFNSPPSEEALQNKKEVTSDVGTRGNECDCQNEDSHVPTKAAFVDDERIYDCVAESEEEKKKDAEYDEVYRGEEEPVYDEIAEYVQEKVERKKSEETVAAPTIPTLRSTDRQDSGEYEEIEEVIYDKPASVQGEEKDAEHIYEVPKSLDRMLLDDFQKNHSIVSARREKFEALKSPKSQSVIVSFLHNDIVAEGDSEQPVGRPSEEEERTFSPTREKPELDRNGEVAVICNDGVQLKESRAYDRNSYDDLLDLPLITSPELDKVTRETIRSIRKASRYNRWESIDNDSAGRRRPAYPLKDTEKPAWKSLQNLPQSQATAAQVEETRNNRAPKKEDDLRLRSTPDDIPVCEKKHHNGVMDKSELKPTRRKEEIDAEEKKKEEERERLAKVENSYYPGIVSQLAALFDNTAKKKPHHRPPRPTTSPRQTAAVHPAPDQQENKDEQAPDHAPPRNPSGSFDRKEKKKSGAADEERRRKEDELREHEKQRETEKQRASSPSPSSLPSALSPPLSPSSPSESECRLLPDGRRSWRRRSPPTPKARIHGKALNMPDMDGFKENGSLQNGVEKMSNAEEASVLRQWSPKFILRKLYEVSYEPRVETKRNRFVNMEGHVEVPDEERRTPSELEREWKQQYLRTRDGRLQFFVTHYADEAPASEISLSGADVDANREERILHVHGGREHLKLTLKVPSAVFDKWRQALMSHSASSQIDSFVRPIPSALPHITQRTVIIELGSCSIRGGLLTSEPSLPSSFFPAIASVQPDGKVIVGGEAYEPETRQSGEMSRPLKMRDPCLERYTMDSAVMRACLQKVVDDLRIDPTRHRVLLSIPQNIPLPLIGELLQMLLSEIRFQAAAMTRQPSLVLYAYDVTTGVVVDIGDRLNIVPVIDGYVVESAICSIPYGATQIRESLRTMLAASNHGLYSFKSPVENLILRYVMEETIYIPADYEEEKKTATPTVAVSLDGLEPATGMPSTFDIDSARFLATEGLFKPKKWGLDTKGLHQLIHDAVQQSPIDSRRTLYRNIFLAGGASLIPGLAERLETELAAVVPNTIHSQVHISPWRYNAAFLGAQVVASAATFEDSCVNLATLPKFLSRLQASSF